MKKCINCKDQTTHCGDCDAWGFVLNDQQAEDVLSAISFFVREYKPKAPYTKKAMQKLSNSIWKSKKAKFK